jgi:uncharacterized membrane protein
MLPTTTDSDATRNPFVGDYRGSGPATRPVEPAASAPPNVGQTERTACVAASGLLALYGLRRRSLGGLGMVAAAGALLYRGMSGRCGLYDRLGVNTVGAAAPSTRSFEQSVVVQRPARDCYLFWRQLDNAPRFMGLVRSVRVIDDRHSHWEAATALGGPLRWDAIVYEDLEDERIAWRTLPGSEIGMAGAVTFTALPDLNLTEVRSELRLGAQSRTGSVVARLFGASPDQQMARDLNRFKKLLEAGEPIPESAGFHYKPRWEKSRDIVDQGSDLSFPASDPPAWTR